MQKLEVGKPFQEGLKQIHEVTVFDFNQTGGFLKIVFDSPLDSEIKEIKQGKIKLGLLEKEGIIFFLIKFGGLSWMDVPYYVGLSQPYELEELTDENKGYVVQIVLIDGMTGIVKALNLIGLTHGMSKLFKELVEKQREAQIKDYYAVLSQIYSRYRTDDLLTDVDTYLF